MFAQMACPHLGRSVRSASFRRGAVPCLICRILWCETRLFALQYAAYLNVICRILQDVFCLVVCWRLLSGQMPPCPACVCGWLLVGCHALVS